MDVAGYWARQLAKVPLGSVSGQAGNPWKPDYAPVSPRQPEPETVKEVYWRLKAERLQREIDAIARPYFWLGKDA